MSTHFEDTLQKVTQGQPNWNGYMTVVIHVNENFEQGSSLAKIDVMTTETSGTTPSEK